MIRLVYKRSKQTAENTKTASRSPPGLQQNHNPPNLLWRCHASHFPHQIWKRCCQNVQLFVLVFRNKKSFWCANQKVSIAPNTENCQRRRWIFGFVYSVFDQILSDLNRDSDHFRQLFCFGKVVWQLICVIKTLDRCIWESCPLCWMKKCFRFGGGTFSQSYRLKPFVILWGHQTHCQDKSSSCDSGCETWQVLSFLCF